MNTAEGSSASYSSTCDTKMLEGTAETTIVGSFISLTYCKQMRRSISVAVNSSVKLFLPIPQLTQNNSYMANFLSYLTK